VGQVADDFLRVVDLCAELEHESIASRVCQRLAAAHERAVEKAIILAWYEVTDVERVNRTLFLHAERGARELVA